MPESVACRPLQIHVGHTRYGKRDQAKSNHSNQGLDGNAGADYFT